LARPAGPAEAAAELASLERSAKNRAENIMIVDLMRSDLSRVCVPGTVRVRLLAAADCPLGGVPRTTPGTLTGRLAGDRP
jgi:anthranilate/para-aminobenzoate synthase component I